MTTTLLILAAVALVTFYVWHEYAETIASYWPRRDEAGESDE